MNKRKKDVTVYLDDILDSIYKIENYLKGVTRKELFRNEEEQDAIIRRLEMIGEAVKYIDDDFKQKTRWNTMERDGGDERCIDSSIFWSRYTHCMRNRNTRITYNKNGIGKILANINKTNNHE